MGFKELPVNDSLTGLVDIILHREYVIVYTMAKGSSEMCNSLELMTIKQRFTSLRWVTDIVYDRLWIEHSYQMLKPACLSYKLYIGTIKW